MLTWVEEAFTATARLLDDAGRSLAARRQDRECVGMPIHISGAPASWASYSGQAGRAGMVGRDGPDRGGRIPPTPSWARSAFFPTIPPRSVRRLLRGGSRWSPAMSSSPCTTQGSATNASMPPAASCASLRQTAQGALSSSMR